MLTFGGCKSEFENLPSEAFHKRHYVSSEGLSVGCASYENSLFFAPRLGILLGSYTKGKEERRDMRKAIVERKYCFVANDRDGTVSDLFLVVETFVFFRILKPKRMFFSAFIVSMEGRFIVRKKIRRIRDLMVMEYMTAKLLF